MNRKRILEDHKWRGKTLVPPFMQMSGETQEISWVRIGLPELLWIALMQNHWEHSRGVELATSLARTARKCSSSDKPQIFAGASEYGELTKEQKENINTELLSSGHLLPIQEALALLIAFYPECPLKFLFLSESPIADPPREGLDHLRDLVAGLYDRGSYSTMMVQATMVWLAFDAEMLKVQEGLALAEFPEIEKYPDTELSQEVAASIRATILMLFGANPFYESSEWPRYFWNQGLRIDDCSFRDTIYE